MKQLKPSDYLDDPAHAVGLLNRVNASGGDLEAVEQALVVVALALQRAGFGEPVKPLRGRGH
jgi:hypothetical protein